MLQYLHDHLNMWNTSVYLVVFTIFFILLDEYIAKPYRLSQMKKRAKHDPETAEALRIADEVREKVKRGELTG